VFRAIHYFREFWQAQEALQEFKGTATSSGADQNQVLLLVDGFLQAVGTGDGKAVHHLAELVDLNEGCRIKENILTRGAAVLPWHYYVGRAALSFLTDGTVPTKDDVKELAIKLRARACLPTNAGTKALTEKIGAMRKQVLKRWRRVFRDLDLVYLQSNSNERAS